MDGAPTEIVKRQLFYRADPGYGVDVATRTGRAIC
jgi:hypothetical protein